MAARLSLYHAKRHNLPRVCVKRRHGHYHHCGYCYRCLAMALKVCKECGGQVSSTAENCPHCGRWNPTFPEWLNGFVAIAAIILVVYLGAVFFSAVDSCNDTLQEINQTENATNR